MEDCPAGLLLVQGDLPVLSFFWPAWNTYKPKNMFQKTFTVKKSVKKMELERQKNTVK